MEIRIAPGASALPANVAYRTVSAPGLGVWRSSAAGVKIFAHLQQVTNLAAPAFYRACGALPLAERQAVDRSATPGTAHRPLANTPADAQLPAHRARLERR